MRQHVYYVMALYSMIYEPRVIKATPELLDSLFEAAKLGMTGDALAYAVGIVPVELRQLQEFDPSINHVIGQARAQSELRMARVLFADAEAGNAKSALEVLKHKHNWVAQQSIKHEGGVQLILTTGVPQQSNPVTSLPYPEAEVVTQEDQVDLFQ